jgi:hypothetical protein
MIDDIVSIVSQEPRIREVLSRRVPGLAYPVSFAVRTEPVDKVFLVEADAEDDSITLSVVSSEILSSEFEVDALPIKAMEGACVTAIVRMVNMQGYTDALMFFTRSLGPRRPELAYRFEVSASMIEFKLWRTEGSSEE